MKKIGVLSLIFVTVNVFSVMSFAAHKVDGNIEGMEWRECKKINLVKENSGNNLKSFVVQYDCDTQKSELYLAFMATEKDEIESYENCSFIININETENIIANCLENEFNNEFFDVRSAFVVEENKIECEIYILFKEKIHNDINLIITAVDSLGVNSRQYDLCVYSYEIETEAQRKANVRTITKQLSENKTTLKKYNTVKSPYNTQKAGIKSISPADERETNTFSVVATTEVQTQKKNVQVDMENHDRNLIFKTVGVILVIAVAALFVSARNKSKSV